MKKPKTSSHRMSRCGPPLPNSLSLYLHIPFYFLIFCSSALSLCVSWDIITARLSLGTNYSQSVQYEQWQTTEKSGNGWRGERTATGKQRSGRMIYTHRHLYTVTVHGRKRGVFDLLLSQCVPVSHMMFVIQGFLCELFATHVLGIVKKINILCLCRSHSFFIPLQLRQQVEGWAERVSELEAEMSRCEATHSGMLQDVANKDERIMVLCYNVLSLVTFFVYLKFEIP